MPSADKISRDVANLLARASRVVFVNSLGEGLEVRSNENPVVNVIAIIGPALVDGVQYKRALWAEIGIGRGVPYRVAERNFEHGSCIRVPYRVAVRTPSIDEERNLLLVLDPLIQKIADEATQNWVSGVGWYKNFKSNPSLLIPGKFFTFPNNLPFITYSVLESDFKARLKGHVSEFVESTRQRLYALKYTSYTPKAWKRLKSGNYIAAILEEAQYGDLVLEYVKKKLGRPGTKERQLFEELLDAYKIVPHSHKDVELSRLRVHFANVPPSKLQLNVATLGKRRERRVKQKQSYPKGHASYTHAAHHTRVEVRVSAHLLRYRQPPPN